MDSIDSIVDQLIGELDGCQRDPWFIGYQNLSKPGQGMKYRYCALAPRKSRDKLLGLESWDIPIGTTKPSGRGRGLERLLFLRTFYDLHPKFVEFADPKAPDLLFKQKLNKFRERWKAKYGWDLFRPLSRGDQRLEEQLHVPLNRSATEFESQILALAKILCDNINIKHLLAEVGPALKKNEGRIGTLERWLELKEFPGRNSSSSVLRSVQRVRSEGVAHSKGRDYEKTLESFDFETKGYIKIFAELLTQATVMLQELDDHFLK